MTKGSLLLQGGAEFGGAMRESDLRAIHLAGGFASPLVIIPAAAAPDRNDLHAGQNGLHWFKSLGATNVTVARLIDQPSANDPAVATLLRSARLIYLLGGFTHYLGQTLLNSAAHEAMKIAYNAGAVIAGSSAGAMVMCEYYFDPSAGKIEKGLNFLPNTCVIPHHNTFGKNWAGRLRSLLPQAALLGIDEGTGLIQEAEAWHVYGGGTVTLYKETSHIYQSGTQIFL